MSFLSRLFGRGEPLQRTPVADWPAAGGQCPTVSLERQALEAFSRVPFGAPWESLRVFGRPDRYRSSRDGFATLRYDRWGLELEVELGKFVQATFLIGDDYASGKRPALVLAEPRGPDGLALTKQTTKEELLQRLGEPETLQDLEETVVLYYRAGPLISEYLIEDGMLTTWDVYLD